MADKTRSQIGSDTPSQIGLEETAPVKAVDVDATRPADVEPAPAAFESGEDAPAATTGIKFNRSASVDKRVIRVKDLARLGVETNAQTKDLVWDSSNAFTVSTTGLPQEVVDAVLGQPDFSAV